MAVVIPSLLWLSNQYKKLNPPQKKYNINVIYDAADTFIEFWINPLDKSNRIMICCSFHPTKHFTFK